jgi:hypothetical protein
MEIGSKETKEAHERLYDCRGQYVGGGVHASHDEHENKDPNGARLED